MFAFKNAKDGEDSEQEAELLLKNTVNVPAMRNPPLVVTDSVSIADLVSVYRMLESAYATFNGAEVTFGGHKGGIRSALAREERAGVADRMEALATEIKNTNARTPTERRQKLRFEIMQASENETAIDGAIDRFLTSEPKTSTGLTDEGRRAMRAIADELFLAELALRMLLRTDKKYESLRLLIDRAAKRIDAFGMTS